jgi:hypothetical protein
MEKIYLDKHRRSLMDQTLVSNGKREKPPIEWTRRTFCEPCSPMGIKPCMNPSNLVEVSTYGLGGHAPFQFSPPREKSCILFPRDHVWSILVQTKLRGDVPKNMRGDPTNVVSE